MMDSENWFCVPNHDKVCVCLHAPLVAEFNRIEAEASHADEPTYSLTELFSDALVDFLRAVGRLPKPYV